MRERGSTRRRALEALVAAPAVSSLRAQVPGRDPDAPLPPASELASVFEVLAVARRKLSDAVYASIAGTERRTLERITFRPRLMVNVSQLDLTTELLGERLFAPIVVGPMSHQESFHPEGELATVRGASAARTLTVVSSRSSRKLAEVVAEAKTPLWFQVYPDPDIDATIVAAREAVQAGCKAVCLTIGVHTPKLRPATSQKLDWETVARMRKSINAPLVLKGVMNPEEAQLAASRGVDGIVVSNHGGIYTTGFADPVEMLPSIAESAGGKIPVLIDGGFRRGTDILKALALGARAVLVGRPPIWGLAAYGAEGVQTVLEILQTELARSMVMCGRPNLQSIDPTLVKFHAR